mgnify:CR=1 FL=1
MSLAMHLLYLLILIVAITGLLMIGYDATGIAWFKNVFRAWDYLGAAILGGDGKHSISAYCGARDGISHQLGRWIIDGTFGKGHCWVAARREGLLL